ncbi:MAG: hypothetical protein KF852_14565 [Saprospiraceae bacterium]|nr:hypothetical protein [Saprospiraceae bacterium]
MVITIYFQSEQDLQWLNKIVDMLRNAAVRFEVQGLPYSENQDLKNRRQAFLSAVQSNDVITSTIEMPNREERNAR